MTNVTDALRALLERAFEVVHHDIDCPAIGGNGDDDCQCDAVAFLRDLEAALTAAGAAPEGFVLVPRKATPSMLDAGFQELGWLDRVERIWNLMVFAAESAATQEKRHG